MSLREQNIQKRRQKILTAARQLVEEKGPEGVTMRRLAKRSGLCVTTLYNIFGNKDDILVALLEEALSSVTPLLETDSQSEPFSAIQAIMVGPVRYLTEHSRILRPILAVEYYNPERRAHPYALAIFAEIILKIAGFLEAAQKQGFFLPNISPRLLAAEIFYSLRMSLEDWGCREIDDEALAARVKTGVLLILLAAATDKSRDHLQARLEEIQAPALAHLHERFPGLAP